MPSNPLPCCTPQVELACAPRSLPELLYASLSRAGTSPEPLGESIGLAYDEERSGWVGATRIGGLELELALVCRPESAGLKLELRRREESVGADAGAASGSPAPLHLVFSAMLPGLATEESRGGDPLEFEITITE